MPKVLKVRVIKAEKLAPSINRLVMESRYVADTAKPGQFVNVKCCEGLNALLRRPISICSTDREKGVFDIVFQVKGTGTEHLSHLQPGDTVDLIGPLGNPFTLSWEYGSIVVVGGGIGIFPLYNILKCAESPKKAAFLGFKNRELVVMEEEFEKAADSLEISTDDGSKGYNGLVTDLLEKHLAECKVDIIYTCGPTPMIKRVAEIAKANSVPCQVSLEQRMGCGIGACLVCACKTRSGENWKYSHVCKDGPVFWSTDVILDMY